ATAKGKDTVIIALTASSFEEEREELVAIGCDDFLRKPFRDRVLFNLIHIHLGAQFVYEAEPAPESEETPTPDAASVAALPAELRAHLKQALRQLDDDA